MFRESGEQCTPYGIVFVAAQVKRNVDYEIKISEMAIVWRQRKEKRNGYGNQSTDKNIFYAHSVYMVDARACDSINDLHKMSQLYGTSFD